MIIKVTDKELLEKIKQISSFETKTYISIAAGYKIETIEKKELIGKILD